MASFPSITLIASYDTIGVEWVVLFIVLHHTDLFFYCDKNYFNVALDSLQQGTMDFSCLLIRHVMRYSHSEVFMINFAVKFASIVEAHRTLGSREHPQLTSSITITLDTFKVITLMCHYL